MNPVATRRDRDFLLMFTVMLTIAAGNTALQSVLPALGRSLGVKDSAVALAFSVSALLWVVAQPPDLASGQPSGWGLLVRPPHHISGRRAPRRPRRSNLAILSGSPCQIKSRRCGEHSGERTVEHNAPALR